MKMDDIKYVKEKMTIFKHIISINDFKELQQIKNYIEQLHKDLYDNNFVEWNEQFTDHQSLNEPIDEYGMTLGEFRKMIYDAEKSDAFSLEDFQKKLKSLYNGEA